MSLATTTSGDPGSPIKAGAAPLLERSVLRLEESLSELSLEGGELVRGDVVEELRSLHTCLEKVVRGDAPVAQCIVVGRPTLQLRLIEALRREVLRSTENAEPEAVVRLLRVLEAGREALSGDGPEDLRTRLARPDAFELLFEVAHDLRSPLTSILFLSETLRVGHSGEVNDVQRSQLGLIYSAALGLVSVATDIVDLADYGMGAESEEPEAFSLSEVFSGMEEMVRPMAEEKGVELRTVVPDYERCHGRPIALGRVLLNLTTNALKFTDEGYVEVGMKRRSRSRQEFYVRDTGRGIPPERQKDLFQPFKKRASREGHFFSSAGVGLSIARRLVHGMGSELELETAPGWGTRFSFTLDVTPRR